MLYQAIIAVGLIVFLLNLICNLRSLRTPSPGGKIPRPAPPVSVLVPARNEEGNIATCLQSLQKQDYPDFEVMVLDDNSSDNTASIVSRFAAEDHRLKLISGEPLPPDWAGKPFACHQLARRASGSWLLFVDADTIHAPDMLSSVIALALELKPSMLSGFPRQLANSLPQKIAIPLMYFIILCWFPLWWFQRGKGPKASLAIGQFLLFPKEAYWKMGGHQAVKSRILEDVWLGVETKRHGGQHVVVDLSRVVACNMYRNIGDMWEGFVKWMHSVASLSTLALVALIIAGYAFFLAPFYWLWNELFMTAGATDWRFIVIFQVALIIVMRWLVDIRFKEPLVSAPLHPLGFLFLFVSVIYGTVRQTIGAAIHWKDRVYDSESNVQ